MSTFKDEPQSQDRNPKEVLGQVNKMASGFIASALSSPDEFERIKGTLASHGMARLAMKGQYEQAKAASIGTAQFALDRILGILIEQENYLDMLERQDKTNFPPSLQPYLANLSADRLRVKKFKDFFEAEYFRIDPSLQVMPEYLRKSIRDLQPGRISEMSQKQVIVISDKFEQTQPLKVGDMVFSECKKHLLSAIVDFSNPEGQPSFTNAQLKEIADTHNHSYLDLLIGREMLRRAKRDVTLVASATEILMPRKISYHQRTEILESNQDVELNKTQLAAEIKSFVTENDEFHVKCQLIKAKIESKLNGAYSLSPWTLGWAGSRCKIEYAGKTFKVPRGLAELYQLVQTPKENEKKIKDLVSEKQKSTHPVCSFFRCVTGRSRSEETQNTYTELNSILSRVY